MLGGPPVASKAGAGLPMWPSYGKNNGYGEGCGGSKGAMTPMPRSHAIAFCDKLCDPSKKKLQVPEHPRIADDLLRESSCGQRTETRLQYARKSKERETRTTVWLDPTGWIPLGGDSETGWYGLFIPNKYACLLHGPSFAARVFAG